jgi:hypothetical protein
MANAVSVSAPQAFPWACHMALADSPRIIHTGSMRMEVIAM